MAKAIAAVAPQNEPQNGLTRRGQVADRLAVLVLVGPRENNMFLQDSFNACGNGQANGSRVDLVVLSVCVARGLGDTLAHGLPVSRSDEQSLALVGRLEPHSLRTMAPHILLPQWVSVRGVTPSNSLHL